METKWCVSSSGRHPMAEQYSESFVPNDLDLIGGLGIKPGSSTSSSSTESDPNTTKTAVGDDPNGEKKEKPDDNKHNSMMVVTGANAGGKSIYLKQNALIVYVTLSVHLPKLRIVYILTSCGRYMAQCGMFVPADRVILGISDKSRCTAEKYQWAEY